ncbi:MAG: FtsX-like permease family protein [Tannerella sp.]|jgi:ABC-type lipoprotein release transport system permease subunit|nr:FtsX-like permease family protein [Tannerella sp.]
MKNIINLAWKNIWRNKVRSGVILGAIAIGLFSGTFLLAFIDGWIVGTVNSDIKTQYSHVQIHDKAFLANYDINAYFMRDAVEEKMAQSGRDVARNVSTTTYRLSLTGMLASSHNALGVTAKGVLPDEEMQVTDVWQHIPDTMGVFLTDDTRNAIVISTKIAEKLKVRLRTRIVFTFQDVHGDMQSIAFRVCGIYKTTNAMFDEANVFVRYTDVFGYTGLPDNAVHEVATWLSDIETSNIVSPQLKGMFSDMDVQQWDEINPALAMILAYTDYMGVIILGIFLFALSFGIINTMLMAVLERTRELGMLGAIGMSKRKIFNMIMLETVFLTLLGGAVGIIPGAAVLLPVLETGIDLSFFMGDQMEDFGFSSMVYPIFNVKMLAEIVVLVMLAGILSAIYPARKALKLKPLDAIREV